MSTGPTYSFLELKSSKQGFTLVEGVVGILFITIAALILASVISFYKAGEVRLDDRVGVQNILLESVADIRTIPFDDIISFCNARNAFTSNALMQSPCFNNSTSPTGLSSDPLAVGPALASGIQKPIEVRKIIQTGRSNMAGGACVALESCKALIPNQLVEVTLTGIWMDPNGQKAPPYNLTRQIFRRVRW